MDGVTIIGAYNNEVNEITGKILSPDTLFISLAICLVFDLLLIIFIAGIDSHSNNAKGILYTIGQHIGFYSFIFFFVGYISFLLITGPNLFDDSITRDRDKRNSKCYYAYIDTDRIFSDETLTEQFKEKYTILYDRTEKLNKDGIFVIKENP